MSGSTNAATLPLSNPEGLAWFVTQSLAYANRDGSLTAEHGLGTLSAKTLFVMADEGYTHFFGNRNASKVVAKIKAAIVAGSDRKADSVTKDEVTAWRAANAGAVAAFAKEAHDALSVEVTDGTLDAGGSRGPRKWSDPIDKLTADKIESTLRARFVSDKTAFTEKSLGENVDVAMADESTRAHFRAIVEKEIAAMNRNRDGANALLAIIGKAA